MRVGSPARGGHRRRRRREERARQRGHGHLCGGVRARPLTGRHDRSRDERCRRARPATTASTSPRRCARVGDGSSSSRVMSSSSGRPLARDRITVARSSSRRRSFESGRAPGRTRSRRERRAGRGSSRWTTPSRARRPRSQPGAGRPCRAPDPRWRRRRTAGAPRAYRMTIHRPFGENQPRDTGWKPANDSMTCTSCPSLEVMRKAQSVHSPSTVAIRLSDAATNRPASSTTSRCVPPPQTSTGGPALDEGTSTIERSSTATGRRPEGRPPSSGADDVRRGDGERVDRFLRTGRRGGALDRVGRRRRCGPTPRQSSRR